MIGHLNLNEVVKQNMGAGGAPAFYPEAGPYLTTRTLTQFNCLHAERGSGCLCRCRPI